MRASSALIALWVGLLGCPPVDTGDTTDTTDVVLFEGPTLGHTPPALVEAGEAIPVEVTAEDADGVGGVRAYFRPVGDPVWDTLILEDQGDGTWTGTVPGSAVRPPGVQYYLRGEDQSEFKTASYLPEAGQQGPFVVEVPTRGEPLPYYEDFADATGPLSLYALGWTEHSGAFAGYPWGLSDTRFSTPPFAVRHRAGVSGLPEIDDWLISPPIDLGGMSEIQVTWREWGSRVALANHALWLSAGSADPEDGAFVLVTALDAPQEGAWTPSQVVDLSAWAGEPLVYLAWRYQGQFADDWWIDEISVDALAADLRVDGFDALPVDPGGQTTVTVYLENRSPKASGPFTVTADADAALGVFSAPVDVSDLAGDATTEVVFTLDVDADHPDDSMLPFTVSLDLGGEERSWDLALVVGEIPAASVTVTPGAAALVQGWLGVGSPDAPTVEIVAFSQTIASTTTFDVLLDGLGDYLPPGPGGDRWYVRVVSTADGTVDAFSITAGGETYESADVGGFVEDVDGVFYLPRPPRPVVTNVVTDPATAAPGRAVTLTATLRNDGSDTVGVTILAVISEDPDVIVVDVVPAELAADGWANGEAISVTLTLEVASTKTDSRPAGLRFEVTDEVETVSTRTTLPVPWPVVQVTGVVVVDASPGGNGDGIFDPGESAQILVELTNQGGRQAFNLECTLAYAGGDVVVAVTDASGVYGIIQVGGTNDDVFALSVTGGSVGDEARFTLTCQDQQAFTYVSGFTMALGEYPWVRLSPLDDEVGDLLGGDFDLVNGRYRSDGDTLEIIVRSATAFDPTKLFLESWMYQQGSTYVLYQLTVQGSSDGAGGATFDARLRGCSLYLNARCYSYSRISTPGVQVTSDTEVELAVDLASMGLIVDQLDAGFGAGFCSGTTLFCDHMPDGWGSGLTGLDTFRFLRMDVGGP